MISLPKLPFRYTTFMEPPTWQVVNIGAVVVFRKSKNVYMLRIHKVCH
jgi:hypothetical protein